jgi:urease accessory protein
MKKPFLSPALAITGLLLAGPAFAHPGHGTGLVAGWLHPMLGLDHFAAMLAVGLWAAQQNDRRAFWSIPLAFVSVMAGGAVLAQFGLDLPFVEAGIASSVLILGLFIVFALRLPTSVSVAIVATFALLHGHAHGSEMPQATGWLGYAVGFLLATASLHALGMTGGRFLRRRSEIMLRLGGAAVAATGLSLSLA